MATQVVAFKCLEDVEGFRHLDGRTGDGTVGLASSVGFSGTIWGGEPPPLPNIPLPPPGTPDPIDIPRTIPVPAPDPDPPEPPRRRGDPGNPINPGQPPID